MKFRNCLFLFAALIVFQIGAKQALACSIGDHTPSFCEMVGSADVIFIGKAIGAKKKKTTVENGVKQVWDVGEIYFEVQESFVGIKKGIRVTLRSGDEDGYCGTWFKHNESYLIYGFGDLKKGFVDGSRSALVSQAQDDIESLRNLPKAGSGSRIFGNITRKAKSSLFTGNIQPMPDLKLKIQQVEEKKRSFEVVTDFNGDYELTGVPAGKYEISPKFENDFIFWNSEVEVKDRGCVMKNKELRNKTKISGRVIDAEGLPVKNILVEFVPTDLIEKPNLFLLKEDDLTDEKGAFSIENVPPGNYTLSVNYTSSPDEEDAFPTTFYPNTPDRTQAVNFTVTLGSKNIENIEFRLPPRLKTQEIKGIIVWSDGTPVNDAHVGLRDAEDNFYASDMRTDKTGEFTLNGFPGRTYFISADNYSSEIGADKASYVSSEKFVLDKDVKFFRLVLERKKE